MINPAFEEEARTRYLVAGEIIVSKDPAVLVTVLGSCVAVCLWDFGSRIGGMNHFVLPRWDGRGAATNRFGDISVKSLIHKMLVRGAKRERIKARLFGGASPLGMTGELTDAGRANVQVALDILREARIPVLESHTGGTSGTKIAFDTRDGSVLRSRVGISRYINP